MWNGFLVFYQIYDTFGTGFCQKFHILTNSRYLRIADSADIHAIISDHLEILRDSFPCLEGKMHIAERRLVSCKYTIYIRIFLHCLGCCIPVRLVIKQIPFHGQIQDFHSMLLQRLFKYDMPVICRHIRSNTTDVNNSLTVIFQHDLCCQLTTISMVRPYHRDFRTEILIQCDNCTLPVYIFLPVQCMCTGNDPIHHIAVQHIQIVAFSVAASYCVADHRLVASLVESYLCLPCKC